MKKQRANIGQVSAQLNLATTLVALSSNTKKTMDFSSYKNKELLKPVEKLFLKQKINHKNLTS